MKRNHIPLIFLLCALLVTGCNGTKTTASVSSNVSSSSSTTDQLDTDNLQNSGSEAVADTAGTIPDDLFSQRDLDDSYEQSSCTIVSLSGDSAEISGKGAAFQNGVLTISTEGDYLISGTLNGQIVVEAEKEDHVRLILGGVSITCETSAPINIRQAEKVVITLAEGSENTLTDGVSYLYDDDAEEEPSAALFSKDDLSINGSGTLTVNANCNNAIQCKDDLRISGGTFILKAADKGLVGRDSLAVCGGSFVIDAQGDAIKSNNDTDAEKGYIIITGGDFDLTTQQDAIQAETTLTISGGNFHTITAGGAGEISQQSSGPNEFWNRMTEETAAQDEASAKGLKAGTLLTLTGGSYQLNTADDAIHCNGDVTIEGGDYTIATGDDGVHADNTFTITGGDITITQSYEGLEGSVVNLDGGTVHLTASDDGINAAGGSDETGTDWRQRMDSFAPDSNCQINISDGYYYINASGDGVDSNGDIQMTGGTLIVDGPTSGGDGALDFSGDYLLSGGILLAAGSSNMAQYPSTDSTQPSVVMTIGSGMQQDTAIRLETAEGTEILTFTPSKSYNSIVLSSEALVSGESYLLKSGGTVTTSQQQDGVSSGGTYSGETASVSFTLSDGVTYLNEDGVTTSEASGEFGGGRPGMGGGRGQKPNGIQPPEQTGMEERPAMGTSPDTMTPPDAPPSGQEPDANGTTPPEAEKDSGEVSPVAAQKTP